MELVVLHRGDEMRVRLERVRGGFEVEVEGRHFYVDHAHAGGRLHSLIIDGCQSEVSVQPLGNGSYLVAGESRDERVEVRDPLEYLAETDSGSGGAAGTVVAYMPGRVIALLVAEGDPVEVGQGVVVLEAMKMENEIAAEVAGSVAKIHVAEGQSIEGGDPLFEITAE